MKTKLNSLNGRDLPSILIGNKADCMQRNVRYEEGENFANRHNMPFMELSVKNDPSEKLGEFLYKKPPFLIKKTPFYPIEKAFKMLVVEIFKEENPSSVSFFDKFNRNFPLFFLKGFFLIVKKLKERQKKMIMTVFQYLNAISLVFLCFFHYNFGLFL